MKSYYVSEIFLSIQGEGKRIGTPSIFIRLFGCNLKCEGFGMPKGELSNERNLIDVTNITELSQLPVVKTGCDSYPSWDKRFRHLSEKLTVDEIVERVFGLIPDSKTMNDIDIVFTGGEPMSNQELLCDIVEALNIAIDDVKHITIETNGTFDVSKRLIELARYYYIQFSVSQKLSSSGEIESKRLIFSRLSKYFCYTVFDSQFKFVVSSPDDIDEIKDIVATLNHVYFLRDIEVYLMPVGGNYKEYKENMPMVAKLALDNGYKFSPRLHLDLYGNAWNT